jgi:hypothetical protein
LHAKCTFDGSITRRIFNFGGDDDCVEGIAGRERPSLSDSDNRGGGGGDAVAIAAFCKTHNAIHVEINKANGNGITVSRRAAITSIKEVTAFLSFSFLAATPTLSNANRLQATTQ